MSCSDTCDLCFLRKSSPTFLVLAPCEWDHDDLNKASFSAAGNSCDVLYYLSPYTHNAYYRTKLGISMSLLTHILYPKIDVYTNRAQGDALDYSRASFLPIQIRWCLPWSRHLYFDPVICYGLIRELMFKKDSALSLHLLWTLF